MARPYSADLRQRVLWECDHGLACRADIAARFSVSESTLYNWLKQARDEGRRIPKPYSGGRRTRVDGHGLKILRHLVLQRGFIAGSSAPMTLASTLLVAAAPA